MRRPGQLRLAAFLGALAALGFALLLSFALHLLFRRAGRLDFGEVNMIGLLEGLIFIVTYSFGLLYIRNGLGVPSPLLLSFGFLAPPTAARAAADVPVVEATSTLHTLMENRIVIVEENGVPIGVTGVRRERISSWDELAKVDGGVAVTDLRSLLAREPLVIVMRGGEVQGIITQKMYLSGLWGRVR